MLEIKCWMVNHSKGTQHSFLVLDTTKCWIENFFCNEVHATSSNMIFFFFYEMLDEMDAFKPVLTNQGNPCETSIFIHLFLYLLQMKLFWLVYENSNVNYSFWCIPKTSKLKIRLRKQQHIIQGRLGGVTQTLIRNFPICIGEWLKISSDNFCFPKSEKMSFIESK